VKLLELPETEVLHQEGPPVIVTVTTPAEFAIVPVKSPTTTEDAVGVYEVTEGVVSRFLA
jgi:hypothetical protein